MTEAVAEAGGSKANEYLVSIYMKKCRLPDDAMLTAGSCVNVVAFMKRQDESLVQGLESEKMKSGGLRLEEAELAESASIEKQGLLVGIWLKPPTEDEALKPKEDEQGEEPGRKRRKLNSLKGLSVRESLVTMQELQPDENSCLVVVALKNQTALFYALVNRVPETGLCETIMLKAIDDVYFFEQFRDDSATTAQGRRTSWTKKIRDARGGAGGVIKERPVKVYDKTRFEIEQEKSLELEILSLCETYQITGEPSLLKEAASMLKMMSTETESRTVLLAKMAAGSTAELSAEDYVTLAQDIKGLWPNLEDMNITPPELATVATAIHDADLYIESRLLRSFIVEACSRPRRWASDDWHRYDLAEFARSVKHHVLLLLGSSPSSGSYEPLPLDGVACILVALQEKLKALRDWIGKQSQALKDSQGSMTESDSLPVLWEKYGDTLDVDSTKLYAANIHHHNVSALSGVCLDPVVQKLNEEVEFIGKLVKAAEHEEKDGEDE